MRPCPTVVPGAASAVHDVLLLLLAAVAVMPLLLCVCCCCTVLLLRVFLRCVFAADPREYGY